MGGNWRAYLDESGALSSESDQFVVAVLVTGDARRLARLAKRARLRLRRRERTALPELKFREASDQLRRWVLNALAREDVAIYALAAQKNGPVEDSPTNYARAVVHILNDCFTAHPDLALTVDLRYNAPHQRLVFDRVVRTMLGREIAIEHVSSQTSAALQIVDFVAGAMYHKYAQGDDSYARIIAPRVAVEKTIPWQ